MRYAKQLICQFLGHQFEPIDIMESGGKTWDINQCLRCKHVSASLLKG